MGTPLTALAHAVLITTGSAGDLFPFLKMGLSLRQRGHRVTIVTLAQHEPSVQQSGLDFHGVPGDPAALDDPDLWHPTRGFRVVWRHTRPSMAAARAYVESLPANEKIGLVVHPLAVPEADLCRLARPGTAIVSVWLAPSNLRTIYDPMTLGPLTVPRWVPAFARRWLWRAAGAQINAVALDGVNVARVAAGAAPVRSMIDHLFEVADLSVMLFPDWFAAPQPDWPQPMRMADFPLFDPSGGAALAPELAAFLAPRQRAAGRHARYRQRAGGGVLCQRAGSRQTARAAHHPAHAAAQPDSGRFAGVGVLAGLLRLQPAAAACGRAGAPRRHRHHRRGAARWHTAADRGARLRPVRQRRPCGAPWCRPHHARRALQRYQPDRGPWRVAGIGRSAQGVRRRQEAL